MDAWHYVFRERVLIWQTGTRSFSFTIPRLCWLFALPLVPVGSILMVKLAVSIVLQYHENAQARVELSEVIALMRHAELQLAQPENESNRSEIVKLRNDLATVLSNFEHLAANPRLEPGELVRSREKLLSDFTQLERKSQETKTLLDLSRQNTERLERQFVSLQGEKNRLEQDLRNLLGDLETANRYQRDIENLLVVTLESIDDETGMALKGNLDSRTHFEAVQELITHLHSSNLKYAERLNQALYYINSRIDSGSAILRSTDLPLSRFVDAKLLPVPGGGPDTREGNERLMASLSPFESLLASLSSEIEEFDTKINYLQALDKLIGCLPIFEPITDDYAISSGYGYRKDPIHGGRAFHYGLDLIAWTGTPILASGDGVVRFAGRMHNYGNVVDIEHGCGFMTRYGHLRSISVKLGEKIEKSQKVGSLGNTGRSTGPHLHYEVHFQGRPYNPYNFLKAGLNNTERRVLTSN